MLGIPVSPGGVGSITDLLSGKSAGKRLIITFVNPHACFLADQHEEYTDLLKQFDIVACDGIGMVLAARSSGCTPIQRESFDFSSLAGKVLETADGLGWSAGLIGGQTGVSELAAVNLRSRFPGLRISACYSGYGKEPEEARRFFTRQQTELVICGMGAPLQERFLIQLGAGGWCGTGFTCGGFLDQVNNWKASYPAWIDHLNLRFLYRLSKEPRRLWRRYLVEYQVFMGRYGELQWTKIKSKLARAGVPPE